MIKLKHGSLFSGYGGLDLAVNEFFGSETEWFCEFDKPPTKVLAHHWPTVPNLHDITKVNWGQVSPVDILSGGSPCQDMSQIGLRAGMRPGTRSGLWENMREAISVLKPKVVVWENVKGAFSAKAVSESDVVFGAGQIRAIGRVLGDLTSLGYDSAWGVVRAEDAGLPHRRERVFVVAYTNSVSDEQRQDFERLVGKGVSFEAGKPPSLSESGIRAQDGFDKGSGHENLERFGLYAPVVAGHPYPITPEENVSVRFVESIMGVPVGHVDDVPGIGYEAKLKLLGNGVAPPQALLALGVLWPRLCGTL